MSVGQHWLGSYKDVFRALGKHPTRLKRRARAAEFRRLLVPARMAVTVLADFMIRPLVRSIPGL
jgi:hypothetical protein